MWKPAESPVPVTETSDDSCHPLPRALSGAANNLPCVDFVLGPLDTGVARATAFTAGRSVAAIETQQIAASLAERHVFSRARKDRVR
jgi:hypothetical protein